MNKYRLYGFSSPAQSSPSFLTPIFESGNDLYVQRIGADNRIAGFEKVHLDSLNSLQGGRNCLYEVGEEAIFGVSDRYSEVTYDTKNKLKHYLRSKIYNYIDTPFFYKEVSEFCNVILPEFYGCNSNRDFLTRQVVSNIIPEFVKKNKVRIESTRVISKSKSYELQLSDLFSKVEAPKMVLVSKDSALSDTYESFYRFATNKHERLSKDVAFISSLNVASCIFGSREVKISSDISEIRDSLTYLLDGMINLENKNQFEKYKFKISKEKRKTYSNLLSNSYCDKISPLSSDGLSFVIFITSRFTQEAQNTQRDERSERI
ncbi:hypothetical protein [Vibrio cholerae]|uniref:hypothetical protein n=1 Tax=Vibrio cholerae TaxID=666 RepID=UPI00115A3E3A|nr:hypothetical protein [Vibrio cholerae]TQQ77692.1 hypothetical protein FLL82_00380 [Vibrio cholerae]